MSPPNSMDPGFEHLLLYLLQFANLNAVILAAAARPSCCLTVELLLFNEILMLNGPSNHKRSVISVIHKSTHVFALHDAAVIWILHNALRRPTWSGGTL